MTAPTESTRFKILRRLGEGGMGVVYEALDRERGTRVALKTLHRTGHEHLGWLKREFRGVQHVHHPNLVSFHELVQEGDQWLLAMDFVEGVDFLTYVRTEPRFDDGAVSDVRTIESAPTLQATDMRDAPATAPEVRATNPRSPARAGFDDAKLRAALQQLADGLHALHEAGMVHRDIKPSNVLVTPDGRLRLLDFGLVAETRSHESAVAGTPVYMAPEQASQGVIGPEADWYAVGVMLYEALTGDVPFDGAPMAVLFAKLHRDPRPPRELNPYAPPDLESLCLGLLRRSPGERASHADVLASLGVARAPEAAPIGTRSLAPPFVGRTNELDRLREAFDASRAEAVCVLVEGESGLGKSRLVARFSERLREETPDVLVLTGHCYERESIPYKAFDGLVDALARWLGRLRDDEARELLPARPGPLVQVFPVLGRITAFAAATSDGPQMLDPRELRSRAFAGLRELLVRIGDRRGLVLVIEDGQWSDHDSLALLTEVTRRPESPRMLLVMTLRSAAAAGDGAAKRTRTKAEIVGAIGTAVRAIELAALAPEEGRELAARLARAVGGDDALTDAIAREAGGHPLFIDVLARRATPFSRDATAPVHLEDVLAAELAELPADARQIAEIVCIAQTPLRQRVVERALDMHGDAFVPALRRLSVARVVVTSGARIDDLVEPYHDRVRSAMLAAVPASRRAELHRRLAVARTSAGDDDPEALALHWREAGDVAQATRQCILAGDRAARALAFDRAATFYEEALASFGDAAAGARRELLVKLGDALANAGRGKRAADVLRAAAAEQAPAADSLDLRRRAAEQLLRSGHFDEGVALLDAVLRSVGVRLPTTPLGAVVYFLFLRAVLFLRGLGYRERDATQVSAEALVRADVCWSAAFGLALNDTVRGAALQTRTLLATLRLGEPSRVARALSLESAYVAQLGGRSWRRCQDLSKRAEEAAERCRSAHARAFQLGTACAAHYLNGRYADARELARRAETIFRDDCVGVAWELDTTSFFALNALANLGELRELVLQSSAYLREAVDRGDLYASVNLRLGYGNLRWLVDDDVEEARRHVDEAMLEWSQRGFHLEHFYEMIARTNLELYAGTPRVAHEFVSARWSAFQRSLLPMRVQSVRIYGWHLRARAALACAVTGAPSDRERLLRRAAADARKMAAERMPWATALAHLIEAGVSRARGAERARTLAMLEDAIAGLAATNMALHRVVAEAALARMRGGERADLATRAAAWFREQTVRRPERFEAMIGPGLS